MQNSAQVLLTFLYAAWLAAAGVWRFVQAGSKPALGFGLTTAIMSVVGAVLLSKGKSAAAKVLIAITLMFVVGFFISKSAKEGLDLRVGLILAASIIEALVIFLPRRTN